MLRLVMLLPPDAAGRSRPGRRCDSQFRLMLAPTEAKAHETVVFVGLVGQLKAKDGLLRKLISRRDAPEPSAFAWSWWCGRRLHAAWGFAQAL